MQFFSEAKLGHNTDGVIMSLQKAGQVCFVQWFGTNNERGESRSSEWELVAPFKEVSRDILVNFISPSLSETYIRPSLTQSRC